ncbi:MAG: PEP-CTERM sorting domain-containing protein [Planctomycetota bacterium]|nr:MAG: PEP-CTERM sorting domain-containing protein [Planctomycetota bacterium]
MTITRHAIVFIARLVLVISAVVLHGAMPTATASAITIDTVPVGNVGNADDTTGYGAVSYHFNIGTTEVTNAQYAAFLNAKAASDPLGLYNTNMGLVLAGGGITRSGTSGSYSYAAISGRENLPVNNVSWYDAIRFANWLHNGQGVGDTESGAYTILGGTATPSNGLSITRNPGAVWWLTSEDEWYKAAYHKNDGNTANYFEYATSSDTDPTAEPPPGGSNSANYLNVVNDLTSAGAYSASVSPYGTFDQAGNAWEWNESLYSGSSRGLRGGGSGSVAANMAASYVASFNPTFEQNNWGFRVATVVPEPSTWALALGGALGFLFCHGCRRKR